jgi:hypothetical protein
LKAATGMKKAEQPSNTPQLTEIEQHVANILSNINFNMAGRKTSELSLAQQYFMQSAVEPRADEWPALAEGNIPESLLRDAQRTDPSKYNSQQQPFPADPDPEVSVLRLLVEKNCKRICIWLRRTRLRPPLLRRCSRVYLVQPANQ